VAKILAGSAAVVTVNTEESPNLARRFGVRGIPAIYLLHHGKVVDQLAGAQPPEAIAAWFRRRERG